MDGWNASFLSNGLCSGAMLVSGRGYIYIYGSHPHHCHGLLQTYMDLISKFVTRDGELLGPPNNPGSTLPDVFKALGQSRT